MNLSAIGVYSNLNYCKAVMRAWMKRGSFYDGIDTVYVTKTHDYKSANPPTIYLNSCTLDDLTWTTLYGSKVYGATCKGTVVEQDIWQLEADYYVYSGHNISSWLFRRWLYDQGMSGDQAALESTVYAKTAYPNYLAPAHDWHKDRFGTGVDALRTHILTGITNLDDEKVCVLETCYANGTSRVFYRIKLTKDFSTFVDVCPLVTYSEVPTPRITTTKTHYYSAAIAADVVASDGGTGGSLPADNYDVTIIPVYPSTYTYGFGYGNGSQAVANITVAVNHKISVSWNAVADASSYHVVIARHAVGTYYFSSGVTGTTATISSFPATQTLSPVVIASDYEIWSSTFCADTVRVVLEVGLDDSDVTAVAYRCTKTGSGDDTVVNNYDKTSVSATVNASDTYAVRAKVKHTDGTWGSYATTSFSYGDVAAVACVAPVYNGVRMDYELEDIDTDGTYVYVLVNCISGSGAEYLTVYTYDSALTLQSSVNWTLAAAKEGARLARGSLDFYAVYVDPIGGGVRRLFYRKASEAFATEHEVDLPSGYDNFIADATIIQADEKDYVLTAVEDDTNSLCRFFAIEVGAAAGTVYETDPHPCYSGKLEHDPYDTLGIWFNGSINNDTYDPNSFNYLTIASTITILHSFPWLGRFQLSHVTT
jgi:hypothetical protein